MPLQLQAPMIQTRTRQVRLMITSVVFLAGKGLAFEAAGAKYGVDPALLASIATMETGHGTSRAAKENNSVMGGMTPSNTQQHQKFNSVEDSINAGASNLSRNYLQKGLTTIPQIAAVYSPVKPDGSPVKNDPHGTNKEWPGTIQQLYSKMGGDNKFFGPQPVGRAVNMMGGYPDAPPPDQLRSSPGEAPPKPAPPPLAQADEPTDESDPAYHWEDA